MKAMSSLKKHAAVMTSHGFKLEVRLRNNWSAMCDVTVNSQDRQITGKVLTGAPFTNPDIFSGYKPFKSSCLRKESHTNLTPTSSSKPISADLGRNLMEYLFCAVCFQFDFNRQTHVC